MATLIRVDIGWNNKLLFDDTKPLLVPMLTCLQWELIWDHYHTKIWRYLSVKKTDNCLFKIEFKSAMDVRLNYIFSITPYQFYTIADQVHSEWCAIHLSNCSKYIPKSIGLKITFRKMSFRTTALRLRTSNSSGFHLLQLTYEYWCQRATITMNFGITNVRTKA